MEAKKFFESSGVYAVAPTHIGIECAPVMEGWTYACVDEAGIATIPVAGPLTYRYDRCSIAYQDIRMALHTALRDEKVNAVVIRFNTPGGDVDGGFDLARDIRRMRDDYGKPIIAFSDGMIASMGYALASACDRIIISPTASVGSIGVIAQLVDVTKADAAAGLKFAVIGSGDRKTDSNPHVAINDGARQALQARVDTLASEFFALVDEHRGCGPEHWESLQAGLFVGAEALNQGLCDEIMTLGELQASIGGILTTATNIAKVAPSNTMNLTEALAKIAALEATNASLAAAVKCAEEEKEKEAKAKAKAEEEEKAKAKAKAEEEEEKKKEEEKAKAIAAGASAAEALLAKSLAEVTAKLKALEDQQAANARAAVFAKYPHVSAELQASLASIPTDKLAAVLDKLPKGLEVTNPKVPTLAEIAVGGTLTDLHRATEASWMDVTMGLAKTDKGVASLEGTEQVLGAVKYLKDVK